LRFGVHISITGGLTQVVKRATERGCETIQIFTRNPRGWSPPKEFSSTEVKELKKGLSLAEIDPLIIHLPYLPNLASPEEELYEKSIAVLLNDLHQAKILGSPYVVIHMGSHKEVGEEVGFNQITLAINIVQEEQDESVMILLENASGQGSELGYDLLHLKRVIEKVKFPERIGVCFDLCHAYQAGYDVATQNGLSRTLKIFDDLIGLDKLHVLHGSDSKTPLGSRSDRHEHIGEGLIGEEGFRIIVNHPLLKDKPMILETPTLSLENDQKNLSTIRNLERLRSKK